MLALSRLNAVPSAFLALERGVTIEDPSPRIIKAMVIRVFLLLCMSIVLAAADFNRYRVGQQTYPQ